MSTIAGNAHPYRWVSGHDGTVDEGNLAGGAPSSLCEGVEPPRSPFVFVVAVAGAGPDGSPPTETPAPLPTLGELPACTAAG